MEERIQKIIAAAGVTSRRRAEQLIREGKVRVNGNTVVLGDCADPVEDVIEVDGKRIRRQEEKKYILLNKPRGFVTTLSDEKGRKTVSELVADCGVRVYPCGRLDMYSEGLLILTNDGDFANYLMHPSREVEKTYLVWTEPASDDSEGLLSRPIELDGRAIEKPTVKLLGTREKSSCWEITIHEGRNRQIRRMCEEAALKVYRLRRIREGGISLGNLPVGTWRELSAEEIEKLMPRACGTAARGEETKR